mgnify:CR=1 FL=1
MTGSEAVDLARSVRDHLLARYPGREFEVLKGLVGVAKSKERWLELHVLELAEKLLIARGIW